MDNYRPALLLPVFSKVLERVVYKQLYSYLEANKLLSERQFGFRQTSSAQHAVIVLVDSIRHGTDDESSGFRSQEYSGSFQNYIKVTPVQIRDKELAWLESYFFDRKQFVDGHRSRNPTYFMRSSPGLNFGSPFVHYIDE